MQLIALIFWFNSIKKKVQTWRPVNHEILYLLFWVTNIFIKCYPRFQNCRWHIIRSSRAWLRLTRARASIAERTRRFQQTIWIIDAPELTFRKTIIQKELLAITYWIFMLISSLVLLYILFNIFLMKFTFPGNQLFHFAI